MGMTTVLSSDHNIAYSFGSHRAFSSGMLHAPAPTSLVLGWVGTREYLAMKTRFFLPKHSQDGLVKR